MYYYGYPHVGSLTDWSMIDPNWWLLAGFSPFQTDPPGSPVAYCYTPGDCPVGSDQAYVGNFVDFADFLDFDVKFARTLLKMIPGTESNCFTALGSRYCDYDTNIWCTPGTTPPLYQPTGVHAVNQAVPNPAYYWLTLALCDRFPSAPWSCVGVTSLFLAFAGPDDYPKYACTVRPQ